MSTSISARLAAAKENAVTATTLKAVAPTTSSSNAAPLGKIVASKDVSGGAALGVGSKPRRALGDISNSKPAPAAGSGPSKPGAAAASSKAPLQLHSQPAPAIAQPQLRPSQSAAQPLWDNSDIEYSHPDPFTAMHSFDMPATDADCGVPPDLDDLLSLPHAPAAANPSSSSAAAAFGQPPALAGRGHSRAHDQLRAAADPNPQPFRPLERENVPLKSAAAQKLTEATLGLPADRGSRAGGVRLGLAARGKPTAALQGASGAGAPPARQQPAPSPDMFDFDDTALLGLGGAGFDLLSSEPLLAGDAAGELLSLLGISSV